MNGSAALVRTQRERWQRRFCRGPEPFLGSLHLRRFPCMRYCEKYADAAFTLELLSGSLGRNGTRLFLF